MHAGATPRNLIARWQQVPKRASRRAFTLMELLVVIFILLALTLITVTGVRYAFASDLARGAARQVQSYLSGAKDLAISTREKRGVRFLIDSTNGRTSTSMVYIAEQPHWTAGNIRLERRDSDGDGVADSRDIVIVRGLGGTGWVRLYQQKFIINGRTRIRIPRGGREWYTVLTNRLANGEEVLILTAPYRQQDTFGSPDAVQVHRTITDYELELPPAVLPGQEPVILPSSIVIDLDGSKLPDSWRPQNSGNYPNRLDVMFSPRGTVVGPAASSGTIHFFITQNTYVEKLRGDGRRPVDWTNPGAAPTIYIDSSTPTPGMELDEEKLLVTVFTQTGNIVSNHLDMTDDGDGLLDDPFRFAEIGEVAGQ